MLAGFYSKNDLSIHISGDISDLRSLGKTISKIILLITDNGFIDSDIGTRFAEFSEKIKKASASKVSCINCPGHSNLPFPNSFECTREELLLILNLLISLLEYIVTDELDAVNVLLLEYILKHNLCGLNTKESLRIKNLIGKKFTFHNLSSFIRTFKCENRLTVIPLRKHSS